MASPRPSKRKTDAPRDAVADRAVVAKRADPRQAGLFDQPLPKWIKPCLPTLVDKPPLGPQWVHEIKWDGYRISAYVADGKVTIRTRSGHDWTARFPPIAAVGGLRVRSAVIDGEAVILDDRGRSSFAELQADLDRHGSRCAVYYAFDLLFLDGEDLRKKPLEERRLALDGVIPKRSAILMSEEFSGAGLRNGIEAGAPSSRDRRPCRSRGSPDALQRSSMVLTKKKPTSAATSALIETGSSSSTTYDGSWSSKWSAARTICTMATSAKSPRW